MELSQGEIIQKPKMRELSSLFMTHRLIVMYAPTDGRRDGRTDGRTGRTGVTLNALPLFFEYAGA